MNALRKTERYFTPAGRIIIGAFFVLAGFEKVLNIGGTAGFIESVGLPMGTLLTLIAILIEIGLGGALLIGYKARYAALGLAIFTFVVSFPFHGPGMWADDPVQQIMFMKNIAITGGLLFIAAYIGAPCYNPPGKNETPTPTL